MSDTKQLSNILDAWHRTHVQLADLKPRADQALRTILDVGGITYDNTYLWGAVIHVRAEVPGDAAVTLTICPSDLAVAAAGGREGVQALFARIVERGWTLCAGSRGDRIAQGLGLEQEALDAAIRDRRLTADSRERKAREAQEEGDR